ncbi:MAG TPA: recombinase XerC [Ruminococcaceae bacterium]|nr:recombinase XerC [Oscillospiraceae bacterium]
MHKEEFHTLPQSVIEFLNYLSVVKSKSELTVLEYASDLRLFFRYMLVYRGLVDKETEFDKIEISFIDLDFIKTIKISDAYAFLSYCRNERGNDNAAISRKVSTLRAFFKYLCVKMKQIPENPMEELESPKLKKSLPKYLTLDESVQLLESIDGRDKERDYAIITLFLNCGLRLSELCSLNYTDIKSDGTLTVTGKGNKERTIYLNEMCIDAIKDYMKVRPVDGVKDKNALFLSGRKNRISPKTVQHLVEKYIEKSGLGDRGFSTHKLRHTAATLMYQKGGVDVLLIKDILGHENLATTEIYTHIVDSQLKNAVESNPLNKLKGKKSAE